MVKLRTTILSGLTALISLSVLACDDAPSTEQNVPERVTTDGIQSDDALEGRGFRALTPRERNNTYRDLLGLPHAVSDWPNRPIAAARFATLQNRAGVFGSQVQPAAWPWVFPAENGVDGFEGFVDGQNPSAYDLEEIQKAALHFAGYALVSPIFFTCESWQTLDDAAKQSCAQASIERFAQRAWRRPITPEETTHLADLWATLAANHNPDETVVLMVAAILQSPQFLFLLPTTQEEQNGVRLLGPWEMAAQLSYFLWDTMPDQALFAAAARGQLSTTNQLTDQARRMLADPKARPAIIHFHTQLLHLERVLSVSPARRVYGPAFGIEPDPPLDTTGDGVWPGILGPLRHSFVAEASLFIEHVVFDGDGTFSDLLTSDQGFMSNQSAAVYGPSVTVIDGPTKRWAYGNVEFSQARRRVLELRPIRFARGERAGLMTLPAILAINAYPVHPAPILRGKTILERLACQVLGAPIPGAEASMPPDSETAESTNRERTALATSSPACDACHASLNPPGFAYESYDSLGRYRNLDNGLDVDSSGYFMLQNGEEFTFDNALDLGQQLADSQQVRDCYVRRWVNYAIGLELAPSNQGLINLQAAFRQDDNILELLVALVATDAFRMTRRSPTQ